MMLRADSDTKLFFQIGDPLDHCVAPFLHNAVFDYANVNAVSLNLIVKKGHLGEFTDAVRTLGIAGFHITMPHKSDIIPYLDEVDDISRAFNSVNHVNNIDGKLVGMTLDGVGLRMAVEAEGAAIEGRRLMVLGAGSISGPVTAELLAHGAKSAVILNRTPDHAKRQAEILKEHFPQAEISYGVMSNENLHKYAPQADMLLQCTCLGMVGVGADYEDVSFVEKLPKGAFVADAIYMPERTKLLGHAEKCGYHVMNGFSMLVMQQKAMLKFHCGIDGGEDLYDFGEEGMLVGLALRQARQNRINREKAEEQR